MAQFISVNSITFLILLPQDRRCLLSRVLVKFNRIKSSADANLWFLSAAMSNYTS